MNENIVQDILTNLNNADTLNVRLLFCRKAKTGYTAYAPNISNAIKDDIINLIKHNLETKVDLRPVEFNPVRPCADGEIEHCSINYVGNFQEVIQSFRNPDNVETGLNPLDLTFYCLIVTLPDENCEYCFYRRITKFKRLESSGIKACFSGNTLNKIEQQIFGIDGFIDLVHVNNDIFIFNHIALERIFRLTEEFSSRANEALRILGETNRISNFEQFENDCLSDARYYKILSRMLEYRSDFCEEFVKNFNSIREVIDMFDLNIEIREGNPPQIVYSDREQRMDILRIINDAYCKSVICERNVIADN